MSSHRPPSISVVMSVNNSELYLKDAIESILNQTFDDFEFIIIDDGSTDYSADIIKSYEDQRIVFLQNDKNMGLARSLNRGVGFSRGKYIARMDADDIAKSERLEKQIFFMEKNPHIDLCGSWIEYFNDTSDAEKRLWKTPATHDEIKTYLIFGSPVAHPSIMVKREFFSQLRYQETYEVAQDYALWTESIDVFQFANIQEPLLRYRVHGNQIGQTQKKAQTDRSLRLQKKILQRLNIVMDEKEENIHAKLCSYETDNIDETEKWLKKIVEKNRSIGYFDQFTLEKTISDFWIRTCLKSGSYGKLMTSPLGLKKEILKKTLKKLTK